MLTGTVPDEDGKFEQFVDYGNFSYDRSEVFQGCTTWLDVPTLTWRSAPVVERVEFIDLVQVAGQLVPGSDGSPDSPRWPTTSVR